MHRSFSITRILRQSFFVTAVVLVATAGYAQPTGRAGVRMVYSPEARAIVLFGGVTGPDSSGIAYELGDTWLFSGHRWIRVYPEHHPSERTGVAMAWDPVRQNVMVFGGAKNADSYNDTWVYANHDWTEVATENPPTPRRLAAMAWDPQLGRMVLYGGADASGGFFDTWEFDGTNWVETIASGPELYGASMAWDPAREELILIGRFNDDTTPVKMYRYTGSEWAEIVPENMPSCGAQSQLIYLENTKQLMFYGGTCVNGGRYSTTFLWDGTDWTEEDIPFINRPGQLGVYAEAYQPVYQESILFGGIAGNSYSFATWRYRKGSWTELANDYSPGPRTQFVFASDPDDGVAYLYGGWNSQWAPVDLWKLQNGRWFKIDADGAPTDCAYPAGNWDPDRKMLVVVCSTSLVYEFDGEKWNFRSATGDSPLPGQWRSMVWDPTTGKSLLFGGWDGLDYKNEAWYWDGSVWTKGGNKSAPDGRILTTLFIDPTSGKPTIFGGLGRKRTDDIVQRYDDMWSYDGTRWTAVNATTKPSPRYGCQYAIDTDGKLVLFGGKNEEESYVNETWIWDGSNWEQAEDVNPPEPRMNGRLVLDPSTGKLTLYGGYAGLYYSQLWTRENGEWFLHPEKGRGRGVVNPADSASAPAEGSSANTRTGTASGPSVESPVVPARIRPVRTQHN